MLTRIAKDFPTLVQEVSRQKEDWANVEHRLCWQQLSACQIDTSYALRGLHVVRIYFTRCWIRLPRTCAVVVTIQKHDESENREAGENEPEDGHSVEYAFH
jgi:hypothetical protein